MNKDTFIELVKLAERLDRMGYTDESSDLDEILISLAKKNRNSLEKKAFFGSLKKFLFGDEKSEEPEPSKPSSYIPSKPISDRGRPSVRLSPQEASRLAAEKEFREAGSCASCGESLFNGSFKKHIILGKLTQCKSCDTLSVNKSKLPLDCSSCGASFKMSGLSNRYIPGKGLLCACEYCQKVTWLDENGNKIKSRRNSARDMRKNKGKKSKNVTTKKPSTNRRARG